MAFSARHTSRKKHRSRILSYSFDLQSCLHKYKRLACRICGNALEKFAVKFAKNITPLKIAKMPPITLVNAWPSWIDARRQYILLVIITLAYVVDCYLRYMLCWQMSRRRRRLRPVIYRFHWLSVNAEAGIIIHTTGVSNTVSSEQSCSWHVQWQRWVVRLRQCVHLQRICRAH